MYYVSLSNRVTLPYKWQTISSLQPPAARHQAARTPETREYFPNYKYCLSVVCLQEPVDDEFYFLSYILTINSNFRILTVKTVSVKELSSKTTYPVSFFSRWCRIFRDLDGL